MSQENHFHLNDYPHPKSEAKDGSHIHSSGRRLTPNSTFLAAHFPNLMISSDADAKANQPRDFKHIEDKDEEDDSDAKTPFPADSTYSGPQMSVSDRLLAEKMDNLNEDEQLRLLMALIKYADYPTKIISLNTLEAESRYVSQQAATHFSGSEGSVHGSTHHHSESKENSSRWTRRIGNGETSTIPLFLSSLQVRILLDNLKDTPIHHFIENDIDLVNIKILHILVNLIVTIQEKYYHLYLLENDRRQSFSHPITTEESEKQKKLEEEYHIKPKPTHMTIFDVYRLQKSISFFKETNKVYTMTNLQMLLNALIETLTFFIDHYHEKVPLPTSAPTSASTGTAAKRENSGFLSNFLHSHSTKTTEEGNHEVAVNPKTTAFHGPHLGDGTLANANLKDYFFQKVIDLVHAELPKRRKLFYFLYEMLRDHLILPPNRHVEHSANHSYSYEEFEHDLRNMRTLQLLDLICYTKPYDPDFDEEYGPARRHSVLDVLPHLHEFQKQQQQQHKEEEENKEIFDAKEVNHVEHHEHSELQRKTSFLGSFRLPHFS